MCVFRGEGTLRIGADSVAVRAGDWIAFPVGPENAHQLINTGSTPLKYLAFSAAFAVGDVVGYPDSKKVAAMAASSSEAIAQGKPWVRFTGWAPQGHPSLRIITRQAVGTGFARRCSGRPSFPPRSGGLSSRTS